MTKYSSKEQETFFKPWRIQVVIHDLYSRYSSRDFAYQVVIRDVTKQGISGIKHSWLYKIRFEEPGGIQRARRIDCWDYEATEVGLPDNQWFRGWDVRTKAEAIEIAKAQAVRLQLPFDLQADIVEYEEIARGKELPCLACGKNSQRTFKPFICPDCELLLDMGRKAMRETRLCDICADDLLEYGYADRHADMRQLSQQLADFLTQIARTSIGNRLEPFEKSTVSVRRDGYEGFSPWTRYRISVGQDQAEAMTAVVQLANDLMRLANQRGFDEGKTLLLGLASGRLSIGEVEEEEVKRAQRQQRQ